MRAIVAEAVAMSMQSSRSNLSLYLSKVKPGKEGSPGGEICG
jgi:hypothetical protein